MNPNIDFYNLIDHTQLGVDATAEDIDEACRIAAEYECASVCIRPEWVQRAVDNMDDTPIPVTTVIGFPSGADSSSDKGKQAWRAFCEGAGEFDMVINVDLLKAGKLDEVQNDISEVRRNTPGRILKVIIESAALTDDEIVSACLLSRDAGANYVKTSTGYHAAGGATVEAVKLMRRTVPELGVKASGGIRTEEQSRLMIAAGATRLGMSATAAL